MNDNLCPRCMTGIDDDGDGNCSTCAKLPDEEAERLKEFAGRMTERKRRETEQEHLQADKLRAEYLKRTGRKEMRP